MRLRSLLFLILMVLAVRGHTGDIAGAPAIMPPESLGNFSFLWSNDFFGRGGAEDDYRTQQFGLQSKVSPRWGLVIDYSILTASENNPVLPGYTGRLDQLSLSLMYELFRIQVDANELALIEAGAGVRAYGDFGGSRIQNSLHRLINNGTNSAHYMDTATNLGIFWLKGDYQKLYPLPFIDDTNNSWRAGYWLDATGLISTERQWDAALSANAVVHNQTMRLWLGVRQDWRENYTLDFVQHATALSESGTSLVFGVGSGPVLFETTQGLEDKSSYGRFVFTAVETEYASSGYAVKADNAILLNMLFPDVELELQYRKALPYQSEILGQPRTWLVIGMHYGKPAYETSLDIYNAIQQVALGVEFEWRQQQYYQWAWPYLVLLVGQRTEQLKADAGPAAGLESEKVSSVITELGAGFRFGLYPGREWQLLFQAGLLGYYPFTSQVVVFDQTQVELLQPDLAVNLGFSFNF